MKDDAKPYRVAEIAYDPVQPFPWYVIRTGTVAQQGGFAFGTESAWFETVEGACTYLSEMLAKDAEDLAKRIKEKAAEQT